MNKRILPLLLAALMLLPMLIACGNNGGSDETQPDTTAAAAEESTASLYDENGYLLDELPEGLNFGVTINMLRWSDSTMHEFGNDAEELNGDGIDAAIFARENTLERRLGLTIAYIEEPGDSDHMTTFIKKAEADYKADHDFDIYAGYSRTAPQMTLSGYTTDLLATEYIDVEKPWWPSALVTECMFGSKLFFCSGDISTNMLWMMIGTFYNKNLYKDLQFEKTPEQMVKDNEWTFEQMITMTNDIYQDLDQDGKKGDADSYGAVIFETNIDAFQTAAGITSIVRGNDGSINVNPEWTGERCATACELTGKWLEARGVYHTNSTKIRNVFFEQRALFITDRAFIVAGKDNAATGKIEFDYGIVPQPKLNAEQDGFLTNLGHPFTMYAISSASSKIDACSAVLECYASESYRSVTPEVFESAMKLKYATGSEAAQIYDILRSTVSFDLGRLMPTQFSNHTANLFRKTALATPSGYMTAYKGAKTIVETGLANLIKSIDELQ